MPKQNSGPRIGPAVCAAGDLLVVIGGRDAEGRILSTAEVWDHKVWDGKVPSKKSGWTALPETLSPHCFAVAVGATIP
jgi:hypothetical protein